MKRGEIIVIVLACLLAAGLAIVGFGGLPLSGSGAMIAATVFGGAIPLTIAIFVVASVSSRLANRQWLGPLAFGLILVASLFGAGIHWGLGGITALHSASAPAARLARDAALYQQAARTGADLPAFQSNGSADPTGRLYDQIDQGLHDMAVETSAFQRECHNTGVEGRLRTTALSAPGGLAAARAALAVCRDSGARHKAATLAVFDPLPAVTQAVLGRRGDLLRVWVLQIDAFDAQDAQLALLQAAPGKWDGAGHYLFRRPADLAALKVIQVRLQADSREHNDLSDRLAYDSEAAVQKLGAPGR